MKRIPVAKPLYKELVDTTAEYVQGDVVDPRYVLYVTHAVLEDADNAPTTIAFGKGKGEGFQVMEEDPSPAAGIGYHTDKTHHFVSGEQPTFRVEGGTASDKLKGYIEGYKERIV